MPSICHSIHSLMPFYKAASTVLWSNFRVFKFLTSSIDIRPLSLKWASRYSQAAFNANFPQRRTTLKSLVGNCSSLSLQLHSRSRSTPPQQSMVGSVRALFLSLYYYLPGQCSLHCKCTVPVIIRWLLSTNLINQLWNVFDFSLIIIFLSYFILRMKGLSDGNSTRLFSLTSCSFNGI